MLSYSDLFSALISEAEFAAQYSEPFVIRVTVPLSEGSTGSEVKEISVSVTETVKDLKDKIGQLLGNMPASKQQIKHPTHGFLKDTQNFAALNIGPGTNLEMTLRSRGGKR